MSNRAMPIVPLSEMVDGQIADCFVLMSAKDRATTKHGKPYFRVGFRDVQREVNFPVWGDSPLAIACQDQWEVGKFYKVRGIYRETDFGPQLEIEKIREVNDADRAEGFDESLCLPATRFQPEEMFRELREIVEKEIAAEPLRVLVIDILDQYREELLALAAASHNHHAFRGGYLEHVLSVTKTCLYLADKYAEHYDDLTPPLARDLVIAGAVLHDIGKLRELEMRPEGPTYTVEGAMIGHILQGRDIVREAAAGRDIDHETMLRLEHIIVAHQRLPEWGSPKPPMTPEAMIVHYADDLDAKFQMVYQALQDDSGTNPMTSRKNPLRQSLFRGL